MPEEIEHQPKEEQITSDGGRLNPPAGGEAMTPPRWRENRWKILGGILGVLVFAGTAFGAYKLGQKQVQPGLGPTPTPVVEATPTPDLTANWKTYTNTKYGYSVKYPTTWFVNFDSPGSQQFSNIKSEYPSDTRVRVDVNHVSREYFDERYSSEVGTKWEAEFKVMEEKIANLTVADKPAVKLIRIPSEGATSPAYITKILLAKDSDVFEISNWGKNKEDQQKYDVVFNLMLSTFRFLEGSGQKEGPRVSVETNGRCQTENDKENHEIFLKNNKVSFSGRFINASPCDKLSAEVEVWETLSFPSKKTILVVLTREEPQGFCIECLGALDYFGSIEDVPPGTYTVDISVPEEGGLLLLVHKEVTSR